MSNSSVFNIPAKVLNSLQDLQLNGRDREFHTAVALTLKALTLKALADNANDVHGTVSTPGNRLSADLRQRPELVMDQVRQLGWSRRKVTDSRASPVRICSLVRTNVQRRPR